MKSKKIAASFSNIKLSQKEKDDLLDAILTRAAYERREQRRSIVKKRPIWKYAVSIAAAAVVVCGAVMLYPVISDRPGAPAKQPSQTDEQFAGGSGDYIKWYTGLDLGGKTADDFSLPDTVDIAASTPVVFSDDAIDEVINNLEAAGWEGVYHRRYEDMPEVVWLEQPETYEWDNDKDENFAATEEHRELARRFLSDSGLIDLIKRETGIELSDEPADDAFAAIFRGYYNGCETQTYIRLHFSPDGTMTEMKMYAVKLDPVITASALVPLEEAVKNTFIFIETGYGQTIEDKIAVTDVDIAYFDGIPFYRFTCDNYSGVFGQLRTLALAVDHDAISANPDILSVYEGLMESGVWQ